MAPLRDELKAALFSPSPVIAWGLLTGLVAYVGPFDTYSGLPLLTRIVYWSCVIGFSILCGVAIRVVVQSKLRHRGYWTASVITAGVVAVVLAYPITLFTAFITDGTENRIPSLVEMGFLIFVVALVVAAFRSLLRGAGTPVGTDDQPRILQRVSPDLRGRILRLSVFDHYVSVFTEKGETRVLMRFGDAVAELEGVAGLQVHRSHWVALDAVRGKLARKGRLFLELEDGAIVPVSRNFRAQVDARISG